MKRVVVVGGGTAGLVSANIIKSMFPTYDVVVVYSKEIGIIGVGEGSTEHWNKFQEMVGIQPDDMVRHADITHKYGIFYENWSTHTPAYFHSVGEIGLTRNGFFASYAYALAQNYKLTQKFSWRGMLENKVVDRGEKTHYGTNQYHFDTFKLGKFLMNHAANIGAGFIEGKVTGVNISESGSILSIDIDTQEDSLVADFFIDATGFHRAILSKIANSDFISYKKYLPCDSAIAFPTPSDESGQIRPYTRARALKNGWMWEIPTQSRRGNGYVFSSDHCSVDEAVEEASKIHGFEIVPAKTLKFDPGYFRTTWHKNCAAVGLAASFVEPLEATSISTTIQQVKLICSFLPTYRPGNTASVVKYHQIMDSIMENILCMISLHYISDRSDSEMWKSQQTAEKPDLLQHLLELWNERCPELFDLPNTGFELFQAPHLWHVAQGQGVLNPELAKTQLLAHDSVWRVSRHLAELSSSLAKEKLIDHAKALHRTRNS